MPRLLIVDDDKAVRNLLRFRLKDGYEIIDTGSAEEALALALQNKPDAILLDLMMPKFSGFELCQALASLSFTQLIPIFIVSGESAARYKDFCESLGAKAYFQKPVDFDALNAGLSAVLGTRRPERRKEVRVRLRVMLKLKGTDAKGSNFELPALTDNVSLSGFLCGCSASLENGAIVEVFLAGSGDQYVGRARVVRVEWPQTPGQRYGFQFVEKAGAWVLH